MSTKQHVIDSCNRSMADWRNNINMYAECGCREKWQQIKDEVSQTCEEGAVKYKQIINKTIGGRDIHIIKCGHVWYSVK
jgi:hypothetical protein